jgi:hypothetical protein
MPLEFGNDFCPPCEPIACVWCQGDDPIGHCPIAILDVVEVHLPEIHTISSVRSYIDMITKLQQSTHSVSGIECVVAGNKVVSAGKNARSVHVEISTMERLRMREGKKERGAPRRHDCGDPQ